jgi:hypothetical protein
MNISFPEEASKSPRFGDYQGLCGYDGIFHGTLNEFSSH